MREGSFVTISPRRGDARLPLLIGKTYQIVLIGDIDRAIDISEAIGRIEAGDELADQLGLPVAVGIAQQRHAVAALDRRLALALDVSRDDILGTQRRRMAARTLGDEDVAIGQHQHLARNLQPGGQRGDRKALRHGRQIAVPARRRRDIHGGQQRVALRRQDRVGAGLVDIGTRVATCGQQQGQGGNGHEGGAAGQHGAQFHRAISRP